MFDEHVLEKKEAISYSQIRIKDTNRSNATQPMASKSHGILALMLSHSVVLTRILHT